MIGQNVGLSLKTTGMITVLLALVMLALGLKILHIIPKSFCTIPLPKSILQRIRGWYRRNYGWHQPTPQYPNRYNRRHNGHGSAHLTFRGHNG
jgi:hypothetical protein